MTERKRLHVLLAALALLAAQPVFAQVLYKLVDRHGRVTYSDSAPKNYDGTVTRLEPDTATNLLPSAEAAKPSKTEGGAPGMAETRNKARASLGKRLREAQARVDAARAAKAAGASPGSDELQTIQHRYKPLKEGELPPRPNCFHAADPNGGAVLNCPTQVPQQSYYERLRKLDEELKAAEEDLAAAEQAYRRGTD